MNYNKLLLNYINECPNDEPILIEDIKNYLKEKLNINDNVFIKLMKTINVYINRLVNAGIIKNDYKGVYYKPTNTVFGLLPLNRMKLIEKKYIENNSQVKGYFTGPYLYNALGLTTQIPTVKIVVTNECPNHNEYRVNDLGIIIRKPKIEITNDNYAYLQLLDLLINKDKVNIEVDRKEEKEIIVEYINNYNITVDQLFKFANLTKNKKAIEKLYELGGF